MITPLIVFFSLLLCLSCKESSENLNVLFFGDVLLDRGVETKIEKMGDDYLFNSIGSKIRNSDFAFINLECPVTDNSNPINKKFIFRCDPPWLSILKEAGITHCNLANNHSNDQDRIGIEETFKNLLAYGLTPIGIGENFNNACRHVILSKFGHRVAIFSSVLMLLENFMRNDSLWGPCQASPDELIEMITLHKLDYPEDYIVLSLHWGREYLSKPDFMQRHIAEKLAHAGVNLIIGHHPHVVQSFEKYGDCLVFYSLGNFIFDSYSPKTKTTFAVQLNLSENSHSIDLIPIKTVYVKPELMSKEEIRNFEKELSELSGVKNLEVLGIKVKY